VKEVQQTAQTTWKFWNQSEMEAEGVANNKKTIPTWMTRDFQKIEKDEPLETMPFALDDHDPTGGTYGNEWDDYVSWELIANMRKLSDTVDFDIKIFNSLMTSASKGKGGKGSGRLQVPELPGPDALELKHFPPVIAGSLAEIRRNREKPLLLRKAQLLKMQSLLKNLQERGEKQKKKRSRKVEEATGDSEKARRDDSSS